MVALWTTNEPLISTITSSNQDNRYQNLHENCDIVPWVFKNDRLRTKKYDHKSNSYLDMHFSL